MEGSQRIITPRTIGYSAILSLLVLSLTMLMANRNPVETTILRTPGVMCQEVAGGKLSNLYNVKVINKTFDRQRIHLELMDPADGIVRLVSELIIMPEGWAESTFFIDIPRDVVTSRTVQVTVGVHGEDGLIETIQTSFVGLAIE